MKELFTIPSVSHRVWTVWYRNFLVFMKTWKVNVFPPLIEPLVYMAALGFGVGSYISGVEGVSYAQFVAPAILAIAMMNYSFFECTYGSFVRMYYQKTFDAIIATPTTLEEVIVGEILWGATRSMIYVTGMLLVLSLLGVLALPISLVLIPFAFLAGLLFGAIGMCFTALSPSIDTLNYPSFLFITPMLLLGGTFFELSLLPLPLQYLAYALLPLTHVVLISRSIALNTAGPVLLISLGWILVVTALLIVVAVNLMKKRLIV
ncbi:ABC transporter permease [Methanosphaerula subterraneus]|uniref:ABC transporter permease n=1 Tax=Methanosphaerula subterraneus TaxID=3350244 RepID=UPI003F827A61